MWVIDQHENLIQETQIPPRFLNGSNFPHITKQKKPICGLGVGTEGELCLSNYPQNGLV